MEVTGHGICNLLPNTEENKVCVHVCLHVCVRIVDYDISTWEMIVFSQKLLD